MTIRVLVLAIMVLMAMNRAWAGDSNWNTPVYFIDKLFPPITTLLAAFIGAYFAFELQRRKDKKDRQDRDIAAANIAIFTLAMQANKLHNLKTKHVDPHKNNPMAFIEMEPVTGLDLEPLSIDTNSLSFLLQTPDPNLLGEIAVANADYLAAIDAFKQRARLHIEELQPKAEQAGIELGKKYTTGDLKQRIGERLWVSLELATTQCRQHVDSAIQVVEVAGAKLKKATIAAFPETELKVIEFALPKNKL